jgi:hypothetical protein
MSDARTLVPINYEWRGEVTNAEMNALHAEAFETRVYGENMELERAAAGTQLELGGRTGR